MGWTPATAAAAAIAIAMSSACGETCPRPTIAGVPPAELRCESALPLDAASSQELADCIAGCAAASGAELCEVEPTGAQKCAIQRLGNAGGESASALLEDLAACGRDSALRLQIYDARLPGSDVQRGAVVDGFVFVVYDAQANAPARIVAFADYVPSSTD